MYDFVNIVNPIFFSYFHSIPQFFTFIVILLCSFTIQDSLISMYFFLFLAMVYVYLHISLIVNNVYYCILVSLSLSFIFFTVTPQINGAQGEATNTDDTMAMGRTNGVAQALRQLDGVNLNPGQKNQPSHKKKDGGQNFAQQRIAQKKGTDKPVQAPSEDFFIQVESAYPGVYLGPDGVDIVPHYPVVKPGAMVKNVRKVLDGYFICNEDTKQTVLAVDFIFATQIPQYVEDGFVFEPKVYPYVFMPLVTTIRTSVSPSSYSEHLHNNVLAIAQRKYPKLPTFLSQSSVEYIVSDVHFRESQQKRYRFDYVNRTQNGEGLVDSVRNYAGLVQNGLPWAIPSVECTMPLTWTPRADVKFSGDGYRLDQEGRPVFNTIINDARKARFRRTALLSFEGDTPFVQYESSPSNMTHALKRICSVRTDQETEDTLRMTQNLLGLSVARECMEDTPAYDLNWLARFNDTTGFRPQAQTYDRYDTAHLRGVHSFVALAMKRVIDLCHRTTIQALVDTYRTNCHWAYYKGFDAFLTTMEPFLSREFCANIPHVKRALRIAYVRGAKTHDTENVMVNRLNACVKNELAKSGKVPRLFVSYDAGCMYANELPEFVKVAINGQHTFSRNGCALVVWAFSKPKPADIQPLFDQLISTVGCTNVMLAALYSDDACYSGSIHSRRFALNADIVSNDSSNTYGTFLMAYLAMCGLDPSLALGLVKQCCQPLLLQNGFNSMEYLRVTLDGPFEGSGTVLTVILNFMIAISAALSFFYYLTEDPYLTVAQALNAGYAAVGHHATQSSCMVDGALIPERFQFLKRSPFMCTDGKYHHALNYGSIFRGLGQFDRDMTPDMLAMSKDTFNATSWAARTLYYVSGIVRGFVHEPSSIVFDALRSCYNDARKEESWFSVVTGPAEDYSQLRVCTSSICARYGCTDSDLHELVEHIHASRCGSSSVTRACTRFFDVDYDLKWSGKVSEYSIPGFGSDSYLTDQPETTVL